MIKINSLKVKTSKFPGGECHVILPENLGRMCSKIITADLNSSDDIFYLLLTVDAIRRCDQGIFGGGIHLVIPYFPYARQDRVCNEGESLSVKVMADLINGLNCDSVTIYDPHSDVLPALLNNCIVHKQQDIIIDNKLIPDDEFALVAPDAGASKKVYALSKMLGVDYVVANKIRDTKTGDITNIEINAEVRGKNLFVVDDICDGGSTFIKLASILRQKGANKLFLYVTHGIFSRGLSQIEDYYEHIYCCNLMNYSEMYNPSLTYILKDDKDED